MLYRDTGHYDAAVKEFQFVHAFERGRLDVLYELGLTYQKMGDKAKAKATYLEALQYNPNDPKIKQSLAALH